jgi:hypothetical protein
MPRSPGAIAPERQRRFDRAFHALSALCPGRERRISDFKATRSTVKSENCWKSGGRLPALKGQPEW